MFKEKQRGASQYPGPQAKSVVKDKQKLPRIQPAAQQYFQRMMQLLAEREAKIIQQLQRLNDNMSILTEATKENGIRSVKKMAKMGQNQQNILGVCKSILEENKKSQNIMDSAPRDRYNLQSEDVVDSPISSKRSPLKSPLKQVKLYEVRLNPTVNQTVKVQNIPQPSNKPALNTRVSLINFEPKTVIVPFSQGGTSKHTDISVIKPKITTWTAQVYNKASQHTFSGYYGGYLSDQQAKVHLCRSVLLNFQHMASSLHRDSKQLWKQSGDRIVDHFQNQSKKTLQFMKLKFPQKKKSFVSDEILNAIKSIDKSDAGEFDIIRNTRSYFALGLKRQQMFKKIKTFLNTIISEAQNNYAPFKAIMKEVFIVGDGKQLKNLIGMKFKQNTPLYSSKQIDDPLMNFQIKSPQVLRVLIKWTEELEGRLTGLADGSLIHRGYTDRDKGQTQFLNHQMKQRVAAYAKQNSLITQTIKNQIRSGLTTALTSFPDFIQQQMPNIAHINDEDEKVGLMCAVLSESVQNMCINYLASLIDQLQRLSAYCRDNKLGRRKAIYQDSRNNKFYSQIIFYDLQFVTFTISDLLRSKCTGTLQQIKQVYRKLSSHPKLSVYRVKNRMNTSNRDFLVNVKLNGTPILCQIQLAVSGGGDDHKQQYFDHFNHFLYEMHRSMYGTLAEAAILTSHSNDFVPYFKSKLKAVNRTAVLQSEIKTRTLPIPDQSKELYIQDYSESKIGETIICSNCLLIKKTNQIRISAYLRSSKSASQIKVVCGSCIYYALSASDKAQILLGESAKQYADLLEPADTDFSSEKIVFAINKFQTKIDIQVFQRTDSNTLSDKSISAFYESNQLVLSKAEITSRYFLFKLKSKVRTYEIDRLQFIAAVEKSKTIKLNDFNIEYEGDKSADYEVKYTRSQLSIENVRMQKSEKIRMLIQEKLKLVIVVNNYVTDQQIVEKIKIGRILKQGELQELSKMPVWHLEKSYISNLSLKLLNQCDALQELNLVYNYITDLTFIKSSSLKKLDLTGNQLTTLKLRKTDFPSLEFLDVGSNPITQITELKHDCLNTLFFNSNYEVTELREAQWELPALNHIEVVGAQISKVNFKKFENLKIVVFVDNRLTEVVFADNLPKLEIYNARQNRLTTLEIPKHLPQLKQLTLGFNQLQKFDLSEHYTPNLKFLFVQQNRLKEFRLNSQTKNIQQLNISYNFLQSFDMSNMALLQRLNLQCNKLSKVVVPENLQFTQLTHLLIGYNMMSEFTTDRKAFTALKVKQVGIANKQKTISWLMYIAESEIRQKICKELNIQEESLQKLLDQVINQTVLQDTLILNKLAETLITLRLVPETHLDKFTKLLQEKE